MRIWCFGFRGLGLGFEFDGAGLWPRGIVRHFSRARRWMGMVGCLYGINILV